MRRPPQPQDNDHDDVDKHCDNDNGDNIDDHRGAVETNAGESDRSNENRDSPEFVVKAILQFNANVIACYLMTGDMRWYIVGCYLAPFDKTTIGYVEAEMVEWPRGAEMILWETSTWTWRERAGGDWKRIS